jgi:hypothetical protein
VLSFHLAVMDGDKSPSSDHNEFVTVEDNPKDNVLVAVPASMLELTSDERQLLEKKLVRKIDIRLLIMMLVMYILNYLDRNNIAAAKLAGLQEDLNLVGDQYQVCLESNTK